MRAACWLDGRAQFRYFLENLTAPMERSDIRQVKADIINSSILICIIATERCGGCCDDGGGA